MQGVDRQHSIWSRWRESRLGGPWFGQSWRSLHSPMLFEWAKALQPEARHWPEACRDWCSDEDRHQLLSWRKELLGDVSTLNRKDLGAGSRFRSKNSQNRSIRELARTSLTPQRDVDAMCRWLSLLSPSGRFLELGTSLGVTSAAVAQLGWAVETWEGCPETLQVAKRGWKKLELDTSIRARCGAFASLIQELKTSSKWDVVYLDGCHREDETIRLTRVLAPHVESCLVVDDIAWSAGMFNAWTALKEDPTWRVSFTWRGRGFLLKAPHMERQHFRLA